MNTALRENINWVGYVDWTVRDFHGYKTDRGTTYNAYLMRDDKTALIDTVKALFADNILGNLSALTDLGQVDYVVCNHAEPDHSGALPRVMEALPNATLLCDKRCEAALARYYDMSGWSIRIVATGEKVSLGKRTLQFIETPMLHWPDSMFTYIPEENLLFSMDAFGQHYATSHRFDDEVSLAITMEEAKTYYANIVMPYGKRVAEVLKQAAEMDIQMIAPSHGVIWRSHLREILEAYRGWSVCRPHSKVLVIYDTMWNSTAEMAQAIHEGACLPAVEAQLICVRQTNLTRIAAEVIDAAAIAVGSATLNGEMMPMVGAALTYLKGLRPAGKAGFAFGSFGWGRGGPEAVDEYLRAMKWDTLREPLKAQYRPTVDVLDQCRAAGRMLAERAIEMAAGHEMSLNSV